MDRADLLGSPAVDLVVWPVEGAVCDGGIVFVKQSGFGNFVEERGVLKHGIVEGYVGR